ncbi:unnamed protein product [Cochlearia groenlandica]
MSVMMGSSSRFNKYGCEFWMGKAITLRSGYAHKFDGKVSAYPGREGGGMFIQTEMQSIGDDVVNQTLL